MKLARIYSLNEKIKILEEELSLLKLEAIEELKNSNRDRVDFEGFSAFLKNIRGHEMLVVRKQNE